jgi:hypothetical protein
LQQSSFNRSLNQAVTHLVGHDSLLSEDCLRVHQVAD